MMDEHKCTWCDGTGYSTTGSYVCCGKPSGYECCGSPDYVIDPCPVCKGSGLNEVGMMEKIDRLIALQTVLLDKDLTR